MKLWGGRQQKNNNNSRGGIRDFPGRSGVTRRDICYTVYHITAILQVRGIIRGIFFTDNNTSIFLSESIIQGKIIMGRQKKAKDMWKSRKIAAWRVLCTVFELITGLMQILVNRRLL